MNQWFKGRIAAFVLIVLPAALFAAQMDAEGEPTDPMQRKAAAVKTSRVLRLTIPDLVDGKHDLELVLLYRDGFFHAGHALVPTRDNLVHRVDPDPAQPFEYAYADGTKPKLTRAVLGTYSYHNPEWRKLYKDYTEGKLRIRFLEEVPALRWDEQAGTLRGTLEVWLLSPGESNHWGLNAPGNIPAWRIAMKADTADGLLKGGGKVWTYAKGDMSLGLRAERRPITVSGRWDADFWKPAPNSEFAKGRDWPQVRGPHLTGAAIDCGQRLIDNLQDARLQWVAEEPIGAGKGAAPKVAFGFYPANFSGWGYAHYSAPVVADGRVYLYVLHPDRKQARSDPAVQQHVVVRRGADPEHVAERRHAVFCFDARTGQTLWRWMSESFEYKGQSGKSGTGVTPCVIGDRLYVRVQGLTCFNAKTGDVLWQRKDRRFGTGGGWSHEESLVSVGGVLLMISGQHHLIGIDPDTGEQLWSHQNVTGPNQLAAKVELDGKEYAVVASAGKDEVKPALVLIQPRSGKVLWREEGFGPNALSVLVQGNIVCGNVSPPPPADASKQARRKAPRLAGAFEVGPGSATKRWEAPGTLYPSHRATPVAKDGYFYIDSRGGTGFYALEAKSGRLVKRHPHIYSMTGGDHNWTWHVATDNRIVTSGCLLFSTAEEGFKRLPGRLSLDLVGGYMCPVKPAIADGRLFVRTMNRLVCYDLRRPEDLQVDTLSLRIAHPLLGYPDAGWNGDVRVRYVNGAPTASYASVPQRIETGRPSYSPLGFTGAGEITLTDAALTGRMTVRVGHHDESWTLQVERTGDRLEGTCTRVVEPLRDPVAVTGAVTGTVATTEEGLTRWVLSCQEAVSRQPAKPKHARQTADLVVTKYPDGSRHAYVRAGRLNQATHELDVSGLQMDDNGVQGTVAVIYHSDAQVAPNSETGGALAATYTIDATISEGAMKGTYTGTLGKRYERTLKAEGRYVAGRDLHDVEAER